MARKVELEFDRDRAGEIFIFAIEAFKNRLLGFDSLSQPEVVFRPDNFSYGSLEHRLWLFFSGAVTRFGQASYQAIEKFRDSVAADSRIINPQSDFLDVNYQQLLAGVMAFVPADRPLGREGNLRIEGWKENLAILRDEFNGDPAEVILRAERSRKGLIHSLQGKFYGIGSKIAQLIIIWFQDVDWPYRQEDWHEIRQFSFTPVDIWFLRLFRQWGIITKWNTDQHDVVRKVVSDFTADLCRELAIEHGILSQAVWHCGRAICHNRPKNPNIVGAYCWHNCPFYKYCDCICTGSKYKIDGTMNWDNPHHRLVFPFDQF